MDDLSFKSSATAEQGNERKIAFSGVHCLCYEK